MLSLALAAAVAVPAPPQMTKDQRVVAYVQAIRESADGAELDERLTVEEAWWAQYQRFQEGCKVGLQDR